MTVNSYTSKKTDQRANLSLSMMSRFSSGVKQSNHFFFPNRFYTKNPFHKHTFCQV